MLLKARASNIGRQKDKGSIAFNPTAKPWTRNSQRGLAHQ